MPLSIKITGIYAGKDWLALRGAKVFEAIEDVMKGKVEDIIVHAMAKRIRGWKKTIHFKSSFFHGMNVIRLTVEPSGVNKRYWAYATLGTKAHPITSKKGIKRLRIREGYRAKTQPGGGYGGSGSYSGSYYYTIGVWHPGVKAREFEKYIARDETDNITAAIQSAVLRAAK